jgi:hypothetical protein
LTSADVTRRTLSLGARDIYAGQCAKVFTETTVKALIRPKGASYGGIYAKYNNTMFTKAPFYVDDEVIHAGTYYHVDTVEEEWKADVFEFYQCGLSLVDPHVDRDATSGTWHMDTLSIVTDVAYRQKSWLDTYLGAIGADVLVMIGEPDYQLKREFIDNDFDAIAFITSTDSKPIYGTDNKPYAFDESANIKIRTINKSGIDGRNLLEHFEQAIRTVATDHPLGSIRQLTMARHPEPDDKGGCRIYQTDISIMYERANCGYLGSDVTLTYSTITGGPYIYTLPNVLKVTVPNINNDLFMQIPGRLGNIPQSLGSESMEIQVTCDLNMEPWNGTNTDTHLSWKRPQTTGTKTDAVNFQVFLDIMHSAAQSQPYLILNLVWGAFYARLIRMEPDYSGETNNITLSFKEYNNTEANTSYKTRWGIT